MINLKQEKKLLPKNYNIVRLQSNQDSTIQNLGSNFYQGNKENNYDIFNNPNIVKNIQSNEKISDS